ncbi:MAG TPA: D-xylose transporter XylE [Bacteroidales bacterium]|nr:D-xylose transporter XylE [Bacteroidales bacterium]
MSTKYLTRITLVATLGGFLFGFDTAVVNGAEKSLVGLFISKALDPSNYEYARILITQYRWLVTSVFLVIYFIVTGQLLRLLGFRRGVISGIIILIPLVIFLSGYLSKSVPLQENTDSIRDITDSVKGFVVSSALVGCIIGAALSGFIAKALGRKTGLIITALFFSISAFGAWQPEALNIFGTLDVYSFIIYRILGGIGIGLASILSPMYIAEISPAQIRGRLVSWNQFAIISGMVLIYFVNYLIARSGNDDWLINVGWRWMFFSGVIPAVLFLVLLFFIPETPRYLMIKNRKLKALETIVRISGPEHATKIQSEIESTLHEKNAPWLSFGHTVIIIGIILSVFQQFVGINVVMYYAANIFRNMGASTDSSLLQTIIVGIINMLFTIIAIFTVDRFGRKPLMIAGALIMSISMLSLGFSFYSGSTGLTALVFMLLYIAGFAMSWGPVTWVLLSEIFPNSIRGAMSIPVSTLWISNLIVSWTFPMMNDNVWLTGKFNHGFSYWIYGIMCLAALFFVWKFIPETKGKSLEEIEKFWKK